jgi:(1->4)-alpha-D-glucan 1-alpha-D-glucosylmutase
MLAEGAGAEHVVAFLRADNVLSAVTRHSVVLSETRWGDSALTLPVGVWADRVAGCRFSGRVLASDLFAEMPVALLERLDD